MTCDRKSFFKKFEGCLTGPLKSYDCIAFSKFSKMYLWSLGVRFFHIETIYLKYRD